MKKMTIKDVSKRLSLSEHTLRYYEKIGIIEVDRKGAGKIRQYKEKDIEWLEYIKALKDIGFTLDDIRNYTTLKKGDRATLSERKKLLEEQHKKLSEQIDFLSRMKINVEEKISCIRNREEKNED